MTSCWIFLLVNYNLTFTLLSDKATGEDFFLTCKHGMHEAAVRNKAMMQCCELSCDIFLNVPCLYKVSNRELKLSMSYNSKRYKDGKDHMSCLEKNLTLRFEKCESRKLANVRLQRDFKEMAQQANRKHANMYIWCRRGFRMPTIVFLLFLFVCSRHCDSWYDFNDSWEAWVQIDQQDLNK